MWAIQILVLREPGQGRWSRPTRLFGGSLAAVVVAAVVGFLIAAGVVIWVSSVTLPSSRRETEERELAQNRASAAAAQSALAAAAADGEITEAEITGAVGRIWVSRRAAEELVIVARFPGTGKARRCFQYTIALPLRAGVAVALSELPACPEITAR